VAGVWKSDALFYFLTLATQRELGSKIQARFLGQILELFTPVKIRENTKEMSGVN